MGTAGGDAPANNSNSTDGVSLLTDPTTGQTTSTRCNRRRRNQVQDMSARFEGNIEGLGTLGKHKEQNVDLFLVFQKAIHNHIVLTCSSLVWNTYDGCIVKLQYHNHIVLTCSSLVWTTYDGCIVNWLVKHQQSHPPY